MNLDSGPKIDNCYENSSFHSEKTKQNYVESYLSIVYPYLSMLHVRIFILKMV